MADRDLAVYGAIFMPTSVINLVAGFVIRPYLTKLAVDWETGHLKAFRKIIMNLALIIAALTVLAVGGAWLLGFGDQPAVPKLKRRTFHLPHGVGTDHHRRRPQRIYMNLFYYSPYYHAETEVHHPGLRLRQRTCGAFFRLDRPDGRNPGRRLRIHAFDGGNSMVFFGIFSSRIYETERESSKTR